MLAKIPPSVMSKKTNNDCQQQSGYRYYVNNPLILQVAAYQAT
jgi:hypothetical protein